MKQLVKSRMNELFAAQKPEVNRCFQNEGKVDKEAAEEVYACRSIVFADDTQISKIENKVEKKLGDFVMSRCKK